MDFTNLKKWQPVFFEIGLIITLILFLAAVKIEIKHTKKVYTPPKSDETPVLTDIPITKEKDIPPAPPKPKIFQEVPKDKIMDDLPELSEYAWDDVNYVDMPDQRERKDLDEPVPYSIVERKPEMIGGSELLYRKINYPDRARRAGIQGVVVIQFIVDEKGAIVNPTVKRGIGGGCDEEALEALKSMEFKPGFQQGRFVPVKMEIRVLFRLR